MESLKKSHSNTCTFNRVLFPFSSNEKNKISSTDISSGKLFSVDTWFNPQLEIIMIGDSTHGTGDFYLYRNYITQCILAKHCFPAVIVEWDMQDVMKLNSYILNLSKYKSSREILSRLNRWPQWMWGNEEFEKFVEWLKKYNDKHDKKIKLYGADLYCKDYNVKQFSDDVEKELYPVTVKNSKIQYRILEARQNTWNQRVEHMFEALNILKQYYPRIIFFGHNNHCKKKETVSTSFITLGDLASKKYKIYSIALISDSGRFLGADKWNGESKTYLLDDPGSNSWENLLKDHKNINKKKGHYLQLRGAVVTSSKDTKITKIPLHFDMIINKSDTVPITPIEQV